MNFNVENLLNVRSRNHGHKPVNQGSTMIKIMVTRESQITTQIVLNNQPNSNTTENKEPEKFTNCSYRTQPICHCYSAF